MTSSALKANPISDLDGPFTPTEAWDRVRRRLRAELGEDVFSSWFGRLDLVEISGSMVFLSVPTRFLKSWIQSHYVDRLRALLVEEFKGVSDVSLSVRGALNKSVQRPAMPHLVENTQSERSVPERHKADTAVVAESKPAVESDALTGAPLDRRLTFANFLVGKSNALANAAAEHIVQNTSGEAPLYNPLYVHAGVGLGKTHLLHAIAHDTTAQGRRVIYLTADRFMYGFVSALKAQTALNFKERLRGIDLLVIDDVQFLQGKSIQQEFCHTLNALIDSGRQIVIAADRPPADLESLDERVKSRLAGGLVVEMGPLDEALRVKIIEARIASARQHQPGFDVSPSVISYVAKTIVSNGRDLDGAVNRLLAHSTLTGGIMTVEAAEIAIRDLVRTREPRKVKIEDIQKLVATHFNVSRADIISSRRSASVVKPRQIAMYLAKVLTLRSLPEIGRRFGGRDHTTVLHAVRKIEGAVNADAMLKDDVELLKRMLQD